MTNAASSLPSQFCSRRALVPPTRGTEHCHKFRSAIPAVGLKSTSERQDGDSEQSHRSNCTTASNPLRRAPFSPGNNDISVEGVRQVNFHEHSIQTLKHMVTLFQHMVTLFQAQRCLRSCRLVLTSNAPQLTRTDPPACAHRHLQQTCSSQYQTRQHDGGPLPRLPRRQPQVDRLHHHHSDDAHPSTSSNRLHHRHSNQLLLQDKGHFVLTLQAS